MNFILVEGYQGNLLINADEIECIMQMDYWTNDDIHILAKIYMKNHKTDDDFYAITEEFEEVKKKLEKVLSNS